VISDLLPGYVEAALEMNAELFPLLLTPGRPKRSMLLAACSECRVAGIGRMFLEANPDPFHFRLHQSARLYATCIPRIPASDRPTSNASPFFDAVAAVDEVAAAAIARGSAHSLLPDLEYEEEFWFVEVLMQRFFLGKSAADCAPMLERYEECLNGTRDARLPVVRALVDPASENFDDVFVDYAADRANFVEERAALTSVTGAYRATELHLSVEGVALVRLAQRAGIETRSEYQHVPALPLEDPLRVYTDSDWQTEF
jgi:hypothetical protein